MAKLITLRSRPVMPCELIELIIELIATEEDIDTLLALALLNYHFCLVARRYIFSYIPLEKRKYQGSTEGRGVNEAEYFRRILYRTPKVATFVRKFDYVNDLQNRHHAPAVFKRLYNVAHFTFGFNDYEIFGPKQADWNSGTSSELKRSLHSFFQANNLRSLQILNITEMPGTLFELLPALEELDLHAVTFSDTSHNTESPKKLQPLLSAEKEHGGPIRLKSLTLRRKMETGFAYLMGATRRNGHVLIDYSQVQIAHCHIEHPDMTFTFLDFLKQTEELTELTFGGYCGEFDIKNKFTSCLNPNSYRTLRRLEFWYMLDGRQYDPFGGLAHELAELACRARGIVILPLEEVTVSVEVDTDGSSDTSLEVWSKLDAVLSETGNFPCLRKELSTVEQRCFSGLKEMQRTCGLDFGFKITQKPV